MSPNTTAQQPHLDIDTLDKGTPLEGISIPAVARITLARFAGATDDYNPMYLDDKVAVATGKVSVYSPFTLIVSYAGRMVQSHFAQSSIGSFSMRMLKLVWPGDVLTCRGVISDKREENGNYLIDADVWADNQRGETVAQGRVVATIPIKKGGTPAPGIQFSSGKKRAPSKKTTAKPVKSAAAQKSAAAAPKIPTAKTATSKKR